MVCCFCTSRPTMNANITYDIWQTDKRTVKPMLSKHLSKCKNGRLIQTSVILFYLLWSLKYWFLMSSDCLLQVVLLWHRRMWYMHVFVQPCFHGSSKHTWYRCLSPTASQSPLHVYINPEHVKYELGVRMVWKFSGLERGSIRQYFQTIRNNGFFMSSDCLRQVAFYTSLYIISTQKIAEVSKFSGPD